MYTYTVRPSNMAGWEIFGVTNGQNQMGSAKTWLCIALFDSRVDGLLFDCTHSVLHSYDIVLDSLGNVCLRAASSVFLSAS